MERTGNFLREAGLTGLRNFRVRCSHCSRKDWRSLLELLGIKQCRRKSREIKTTDWKLLLTIHSLLQVLGTEQWTKLGGPFILFLFFTYVLPRCLACGISVPQPGTEPALLAVKAQIPNYWTTREFLRSFILKREPSLLVSQIAFLCSTFHSIIYFWWI